jgi:hypothetical protein
MLCALQVYRALVRGEPAAVKLVPLHCQPGVEDQLLEPSVQGLSTLLESDDQRVAALRRELAVIVRGWQKLEHVCKWVAGLVHVQCAGPELDHAAVCVAGIAMCVEPQGTAACMSA